MTNIVVSTVPATGPAPLGAGTYAGTAMAKLASSIFTNPALEVLMSGVESFSIQQWRQYYSRCVKSGAL